MVYDNQVARTSFNSERNVSILSVGSRSGAVVAHFNQDGGRAVTASTSGRIQGSHGHGVGGHLDRGVSAQSGSIKDGRQSRSHTFSGVVAFRHFTGAIFGFQRRRSRQTGSSLDDHGATSIGLHARGGDSRAVHHRAFGE